MFASQYKLDNLCVIVDVNGLQIDGKCEDVMNAEPIDKKMEAFGLNVIKINGNDFDELEKAFNALPAANIANVANGILPVAAIPAATPIIFDSAIPQLKSLEG